MRLEILLLFGLTGCRQILGLEPPAKATTDGAMDAEIVADAGLCATVSVECASSTVLRTCAALGAEVVDTSCAWGCLASSSAHCASVVPTGGAVTVDDVAITTGLAALELADVAVIDTDSGAIGSQLDPTAVRAPGAGISAGIDYRSTGTVGVFRVKSLTINGLLRPVGARALAFVAEGDVTINGIVDMRVCSGLLGGPGGFAGGAADADAAGFGGGRAGLAGDNGGGGGGHASAGAPGGGGPTTGGMQHGDPAITILRGGGGGGGGAGADGGSGAGGGGAIQIVTNGRILISALGGINAGGCGAPNIGDIGDGGGGGGAGGTILLEAPIVVVDGGVAVNGGGGAGGNDQGLPGAHASLGRDPALGGEGPGTAGAGGDGAAATTMAMPGEPGNGDGGGGGGIGRIRINTRYGTTTVSASAVMSPSFFDLPAATQAAATVQ